MRNFLTLCTLDKRDTVNSQTVSNQNYQFFYACFLNETEIVTMSASALSATFGLQAASSVSSTSRGIVAFGRVAT